MRRDSRNALVTAAVGAVVLGALWASSPSPPLSAPLPSPSALTSPSALSPLPPLPIPATLSSLPPPTPSPTPSSTPSPAPPPPLPPPPASPYAPSPTSSWYATAKGDTLVHSSPGGPALTTLHATTALGSPLTFLVASVSGAWAEVYLPSRPNGSLGYVALRDVDLTQNPYRLVASLSAHTLTLFKANSPLSTWPIATGTPSTPTPTGLFYVTERNFLTPRTGPYGPAAIGLSGHSDVYTRFGIGDGDVGIHGTDEPSSIGHSASHGCMRMRNSDVSGLVSLVPWGTPVYVS